MNWTYYNHAAILDSEPHIEIDLANFKKHSILNLNGKKPLFATWTSNFDTEASGEWWFTIKDTPFDISRLSSKRRYNITSGIKNFTIIKINPTEYREEIYNVQVAAFSAYQEFYRPSVDKENFINNISVWKNVDVFAAFEKDSGKFVAYSLINKGERCINLSVLKTDPVAEKKGVNAALIYFILLFYENDIKEGCYISNGQRNINHITNFNDDTC